MQWNQCDNDFKDDVSEVHQSDEIEKVEENPELSTTSIPLDRVIEALSVVNQWAEASDIDVNDLIVIKRLRDKAILQKTKSSHKQTRISDFFTKK